MFRLWRQIIMDSTLRRTWAEIDMDALAHNYETLRKRIGENVKFLGVVKADAYGHGSVQVSRLLQELGADYLAVSSIDEAIELRHNSITMPILILGHTPKEEVGQLIKNNITQAVTCKAKALEYSEEAVRCGGTLKIHIKVDTGMSRLGYLCDGDYFDSGVEGICEGCSLPGLDAEGIFTHFAPYFAYTLAIPSPMPFDAPVITATFPSNFPITPRTFLSFLNAKKDTKAFTFVPLCTSPLTIVSSA